MDEKQFTSMLRCSGYLPPSTDAELDAFNELHKDYDFKLKDVRIDPLKIINNSKNETN